MRFTSVEQCLICDFRDFKVVGLACQAIRLALEDCVMLSPNSRVYITRMGIKLCLDQYAFSIRILSRIVTQTIRSPIDCLDPLPPEVLLRHITSVLKILEQSKQESDGELSNFFYAALHNYGFVNRFMPQ